MLGAGDQSTGARGEKFRRYRRIPPLQEYILVSQREPFIERHQRAENGLWLSQDIEGFDATLHLASLDVSIPLTAIYRDSEGG